MVPDVQITYLPVSPRQRVNGNLKGFRHWMHWLFDGRAQIPGPALRRDNPPCLPDPSKPKQLDRLTGWLAVPCPSSPSLHAMFYATTLSVSVSQHLAFSIQHLAFSIDSQLVRPRSRLHFRLTFFPTTCDIQITLIITHRDAIIARSSTREHPSTRLSDCGRLSLSRCQGVKVKVSRSRCQGVPVFRTFRTYQGSQVPTDVHGRTG